MKINIPKPINATQQQFAHLCELGGGLKGGPVRHKVLELLRDHGKKLNAFACETAKEHLAAVPEANPWHVCFAVGLCWGHLAKPEVDFTQHVVRAIADLDDAELAAATKYHYERGPLPIEQSVRGARVLFDTVTLPETLPDTLEGLSVAQQRWFGPIIGPRRPPYIGSWNATAMFMVALFAQPALAASQSDPKPLLPPGGPIFGGLSLLHKAGILSKAPDGSPLDDAAFEPGVLYLNNALLVELREGIEDWGLIDVHSGVYMLGTRHAQSASWI